MKLQKIQLNYRTGLICKTHIDALVVSFNLIPGEICFSALLVEEFKSE